MFNKSRHVYQLRMGLTPETPLPSCYHIDYHYASSITTIRKAPLRSLGGWGGVRRLDRGLRCPRHGISIAHKSDGTRWDPICNK